MGIISKSPTISHGQKGSATKTYNAAGSGSRPTSGKKMLPTSAPTDPRTLGRDVPGSLK